MSHVFLAKVGGTLCTVKATLRPGQSLEDRGDGWLYCRDRDVAVLKTDVERAMAREEFQASPLGRWKESWG